MKRLFLIGVCGLFLNGCVMMTKSRFQDEMDLARHMGRLELATKQMEKAQEGELDRCRQNAKALQRELEERKIFPHRFKEASERAAEKTNKDLNFQKLLDDVENGK